MCMGKVVVRCPICKNQIQVTRPDSSHPFWTISKPREDEGVANIVEQVLECKNSSCASQFSIFWYDK
jgi:hypothetical protein